MSVAVVGDYTTLEGCEAVIERGLATFVEVGEALLAIRDARLYRESHGTFEDYCRERWNMTPQHGGRLIAAAEVAVELEPIGSIPSESVARELAPLRDEPDVMRDAWQDAQAASPDRAPTAAIVREKVRDKMGVHFSSASPEWSTPQDLFDLLNAEFDFTVDVCATPGMEKCKRYFSPEQDGLKQKWTGTCWMNPPYGSEIGAWIEKAARSADGGATVVCLVPARVDTGWWWNFVSFAEVRFIRGRLKFGGADTSAPFPSAVVVFGKPTRTVYWEWR
jgi:phage N-6-adenine-methyltransferase